MKVVVFGSKGYIGKVLCNFLRLQNNCELLEVYRGMTIIVDNRLVVIDDFLNIEDWSNVLEEAAVVVYCAGAAHNKYTSKDAVSYFASNNDVPLQIFRSCNLNCVSKFIYLSSISVVVDGGCDKVLNDFSEYIGSSDYANSKILAERNLLSAALDGNTELIALRIPMVYGADAPGNFASLLKLIRSSMPLPFGSITHNRRSYISEVNLCGAINSIINHNDRSQGIYCLCDDLCLSTADFISFICTKFGLKNRCFNFPINLLVCMLVFMGKRKLSHSITSNLVIDSSRFRSVFHWIPENVV